MKEIKLNTVLFTRDGRECGNAIVIKISETSYTIKTDYGDEITHYGELELRERFHISDVARPNHKNFVSPAPSVSNTACYSIVGRGQHGRLFVTGGFFVQVYVLPDDRFLNPPYALPDEAVLVYDEKQGGWFHEGPWKSDFEALIKSSKQEELKKITDEAAAQKAVLDSYRGKYDNTPRDNS